VTTGTDSPGRGFDAPRVPFVASLRVRPDVITLGADGAPRVSIRVEVPEVWDMVRIDVPLTESVLTVKTRALTVLYPDHDHPADFVVKRNGIEVRNELVSLADVGVQNGSTLLLTSRRRRPVRS
jgi:hypothetical protein